MKRTSIILGILGALLGLIIVGLAALFWPFIQDGLKSRRQIESLKHRSDYPEIASACRNVTALASNGITEIGINDPGVPVKLRELGARYIVADNDSVRLEFHGGFDHYGYEVTRSENNSNVWELRFYTESQRTLITCVTNE